MNDLQWLMMAADRARELPDQNLDWKWVRTGDEVVFAVPEHRPFVGDVDGLIQLEIGKETVATSHFQREFYFVRGAKK